MSIISSRLTPSGFFAAVAAAAAAAPAAVELPLAALSFRSPPGAAVPAAAAAADPLPSAPLAPPPEVALVIPRMSRTVAILVGSALLCSALLSLSLPQSLRSPWSDLHHHRRSEGQGGVEDHKRGPREPGAAFVRHTLSSSSSSLFYRR